MELGTIQRELYIDATPAVVFEVVSDPQHVQHWWPDEARYQVCAGSTGEIVFGDRAAGGTVVAFTVVESSPPQTFSFRWTQTAGEVGVPGNSLLVTFELISRGVGTLLRMTETGFRDLGWEVAVLEQQVAEHETGWDFYLPRLIRYVASIQVRG